MRHQMEFTDPNGMHHVFEFEIIGFEARGEKCDVYAGDFTRQIIAAHQGFNTLTIDTKVYKHTASFPTR